jgi:hypothetical protein
MLIAVTVNFHDHEPSMEYVDTNKLDPNDYVDSELLKAIQADEEFCNIDASNWEDEPHKFPSDPPEISGKAVLSRKPKKLDGAIVLNITFDC